MLYRSFNLNVWEIATGGINLGAILIFLLFGFAKHGEENKTQFLRHLQIFCFTYANALYPTFLYDRQGYL